MIVLLRLTAGLITPVLAVGRHIAWVALALMVSVILAQVFFRYVLNNALAWPDEAARFLMLWMTALIAPTALRVGGFVSITMLASFLGQRPAQLLNVILLCMAMLVLLVSIQHGYKHTFGFGGKFDSSSLRIPLNWFGYDVVKVKLRYMYGSLLLCVLLMIAVMFELILRSVILLFNPKADLPEVPRFVQNVETD
ncbi:TRAP transporter small permease subunit [Alphaproteobacteria bacterium]|jgi:TRAP-type transport system small permease protein|nr:TRAP transporter small permease subunit [Alphaproteobacteria bacterium]